MVGTGIKKIRKASGYNQRDFCKKFKLDQPHLSLIENNKKKPSYDLLNRLAKALKTNVAVFYIVGLERKEVVNKKAYDVMFKSAEELILSFFKK